MACCVMMCSSAAFAAEDFTALFSGKYIKVHGRLTKSDAGKSVTALLVDNKFAESRDGLVGSDVKYVNQTVVNENGEYYFKFKYSGSITDCALLVSKDGAVVNNSVSEAIAVTQKIDAAYNMYKEDGAFKTEIYVDNYFNTKGLSYKAYVAIYDKNGMVIKIKATELTPINDGMNTALALLDYDSVGDETARAFIWTEQQLPLCKTEAYRFNPLYGKTLYVVGSSISYGYTTDGTINYATIIADKNNMTLVNKSASGTTMAVRDGLVSSYYERIKYLPEREPDYVIVKVGSNDALNNIPLGAVTAEKDGNYDVKTVAGAMEGIVYQLKQRCPNAKICWLTNFYGIHYSDAAKAEMYRQAVEIAHQIDEKWDTPVCDTYRDMDVSLYDENFRSTYTSDGCHPTVEGYQLWAPFIESFLKSLS